MRWLLLPLTIQVDSGLPGAQEDILHSDKTSPILIDNPVLKIHASESSRCGVLSELMRLFHFVVRVMSASL